MPQWYNDTMIQWYNATMLQCYIDAMLQCYSATMLQCYNATMLQCYNATMLQCHNATVLQCYNCITLLWTENCWPHHNNALGVSCVLYWSCVEHVFVGVNKGQNLIMNRKRNFTHKKMRFGDKDMNNLKILTKLIKLGWLQPEYFGGLLGLSDRQIGSCAPLESRSNYPGPENGGSRCGFL